MRNLRIVFMGTPHFAVGILQRLVEEGYTIAGVITSPDKPAGRGRKLSQSAVKEYALSQNLPILQPTNLKDEEFLEELKALKANLQIVVAFRMLPKVVWSLPEYGTFNLHASLLPKYRGAAPINWAIINGEKETGVTTFFIDEKIDTGAIIDSSKVTIAPDETAGSLHDKLMELGAELVVETVKKIEVDKVTPHPQPMQEEFLEAPKLTPENTRIDWQWTGNRVDHFVRGLCPYPAAWTHLHQGGEPMKTKIYSVRFEPGQPTAGTGTIEVDKKELKVAVSDGYIKVLELQLPGKRRMTVGDLLNGFSFDENAKFV